MKDKIARGKCAKFTRFLSGLNVFQVEFKDADIYRKFIQLIRQPDTLSQRVLLAFRNAKGLPEDLFDKEITLCDKQGVASVLISKELITKSFVIFENLLHPYSNESQTNVITLDLSPKALFYLKAYVYTGKFKSGDLMVLQELLQFAKMSMCPHFEEVVTNVLFEAVLDPRNRQCDLSLIKEMPHQFARYFFDKHDIEYEVLPSGCFEIPVTAFSALYTGQVSLVLTIIITTIDRLRIDTSHFAPLNFVKAKYRRQILGLSDVKGMKSYEELAALFRNVQFDDLTKLKPLEPDSASDFAVYLHASKFVDEEKYDDAKRILKERIEKGCNDDRIFSYYGYLLWKGDEDDVAKSYFEKSLKYNPKNAMALTYLGAIAVANEQYKEAMAYSDKAVHYAPKESLAYEGRAEAHQFLGNLAAAEEDYREALRLEPERGRIRVLLAELLMQKPDGLSEAVSLLNEAVKDSNNESFFMTLAEALMLQGDLQGAEEALNKALEIAPKFEYALRVLGQVLHKQGRYMEAKATFEAIIQKINPLNKHAKRELEEIKGSLCLQEAIDRLSQINFDF